MNSLLLRSAKPLPTYMTWELIEAIFSIVKKITMGHRFVFRETLYAPHILSTISTPNFVEFQKLITSGFYFSPVETSIYSSSCNGDTRRTLLFFLGTYDTNVSPPLLKPKILECCVLALVAMKSFGSSFKFFLMVPTQQSFFSFNLFRRLTCVNQLSPVMFLPEPNKGSANLFTTSGALLLTQKGPSFAFPRIFPC